ncbi:MAG: DUF418 domain-containing protein [Steroidobacteraceae bacterium]
MHNATVVDPTAVAPIGAGERVHELDVLRGVALFGVFLMNMIGLTEADVMATRVQLESLPTAHIDHTVFYFINWLFLDKANTLFAFLFGLGFYLQMERLEAHGADFVRLYRRRLAVLLLMGIVHIMFIWVWDILHLYALAGFALLALRKIKTRTLLIGGVALATFGRMAQDIFAEFAGLNAWHGLPSPYSTTAVLVRQALSAAGDYGGLFLEFAKLNLVDYLLNASIVGWFAYALGRFMLGAWVGRHGWIQHAADYLPGFRRTLWATLPAGLILGGAAQSIFASARTESLSAWVHWLFVGRTLHLIAVPLLATGYLCAIVVGLHTQAGRRLLTPFAWSGRMALTNYFAQSLFYAVVLFGVGPGLDLAGRIGASTVLTMVIVAYATQILFSRWWLSRFNYGPAEWLWRGLTYGRLPPLARH